MPAIYNNNKLQNKIYLAGPFFNLAQIEVAENIERFAAQAGLDYFSPRKRCYCPPTASIADRVNTFAMNVNAIELSDLVLACIDDFDAGTMWEMGYAYRAAKPVYAYTTIPGRGLNLMLAQSCKGFLSGYAEISKFLGKDGYVEWTVAHKIHNGEII